MGSVKPEERSLDLVLRGLGEPVSEQGDSQCCLAWAEFNSDVKEANQREPELLIPPPKPIVNSPLFPRQGLATQPT